MNHVERMIQLVEAAGGRVEDDLFVTRPGVRLLSVTELTDDGRALCDAMHIDTTRPDYEQLAELNGRITYLAFRDEPGDGAAYNQKMVNEHGHLSVHAATVATFLIAGVSVETCLELVAHTEAKVARLTSSRSKAMDRVLYRVQGSADEQRQQRRAIVIAIERGGTQDAPQSLDEREWRNRLAPAAKAVALTYTMSIKDFHKTFIGRLSPHGVELEMRETCEAMCTLLHAHYPLVVKPPAHYYALHNELKYALQ